MTEQLTFIEINPGLGSTGFAAERAGMLRVGALDLTQDVKDAYVGFHGSGSDEPLAEHADLIVADLPFSLFVEADAVDPDVASPISLARKAVGKSGSAVFRVKWDLAERLGRDTSAYGALIATAFPKHSVKVLLDRPTNSDLVSTADLYLVATPEPLEFEITPRGSDITSINPFPLSTFERAKVDPQQILALLGFPENFHRLAAIVPTLDDRVRESADVIRAAAVVGAVAKHLQG